ncbi:WXG100 family type VII secretion target [Bacillus aquiflavi]|uniref:ESAT-6-like protein n=1 Tax=Bacillus aquiflavi TaxID=2672567 RepID=A0A6B3W0Z7_9BACI|nr:WXG100 family type VII secretion target [Bacillus aquiflavi]MBA4536867.1 WXG100 family type VII secretion target [Bacillus aquiflavi]NEY81234.1 WXG100 family type VII secretion target [Bacillus aquiflavi]UAC48458.1 WXG100 family type VII secretion target [Bacillus aquiflavi]
MNSESVRALAREFQRSSENVKLDESKLMQSVHSNTEKWSGKARNKFDSALNEAKVLFQRHSDNLYEISRELESAANEVDRVKEEIERQKELERLANLKD